MFQYAMRAFGWKAKPVAEDHYGIIATISEQKEALPGCAEDTREYYHLVTIRDPKGNISPFVIFHDEMPTKHWSVGDFVSFQTRNLPDEQYGSGKAIIKDSLDVIIRGRQTELKSALQPRIRLVVSN